MRENNIESKLEHWIMTFLSKPSASFNNLPPCPFAKKAWMDKKVLVIDYWINQPYDKLLSGELDLFIYPLEDYRLDIFEEYVDAIRYALGDKFVVLDDHPDNKEEVDGVDLNFGVPLVFIQSREKLQEGREQLKKLGYYNHFESSYLDDIWDC